MSIDNVCIFSHVVKIRVEQIGTSCTSTALTGHWAVYNSDLKNLEFSLFFFDVLAIMCSHLTVNCLLGMRRTFMC